jgi:7-cyano-7-deazaguanine tRNA-ribosyltransferase
LSFEIRYSDLAGRIGKLSTPHGVIETPAFIPVVHPVKQSLSPHFLKSLGFEAVITNAYIALGHYGAEAIRKGIHSIIDYDGVVMTDSGGYQVLEYGSIDLKPSTIAEFERDIRSDICIPLDKPTGYGLKYEIASKYVDETLRNSQATLDIIGKSENSLSSIWVGPVQGAEHLDLVKKSAEALDKMHFQMFALGSPVQLMEAYEFAVLADIISALKRAIPAKPIHLFGAGHPLTIPLAVALGCDTFDSASYILYARDNRYMHQNGTSKLEDLNYFSCQCPVCSSFTAKELQNINERTRVNELAKHNLYVLRAEVLAVKQSIRDGRLWEYVTQKSHAHPKLREAIMNFPNYEFLEIGTPLFKKRAIYFYEPIDQYRPEARRFRDMTLRFKTRKKGNLIFFPEAQIAPFYTSIAFQKLRSKFPNDQICTYNPYLGIIPAEVSDIFPAAHKVIPRINTTIYSAEDFPTFVESFTNFLQSNDSRNITIIADLFMRGIVKDYNPHDYAASVTVLDYRHDVIDTM